MFIRALTLWAAVTFGLVAADDQKAVDNAKPAAATDLQFLVDASVLIHADEQYSELAEDRASPTVKKFASQLVASHQQMQKDLAAVVKDRNIGVVAGTEKATRTEKARLADLKGGDFDRAYLNRLISDHQMLIKMCEGQIAGGKDAQLTGFAKKVLPELREHLKTAQGLAKGR